MTTTLNEQAREAAHKWVERHAPYDIESEQAMAMIEALTALLVEFAEEREKAAFMAGYSMGWYAPDSDISSDRDDRAYTEWKSHDPQT